MELELNKDYWEGRYVSGETGWDIGEIAEPIKKYVDSLTKNLRILIPGCGNAHEAKYLYSQGFDQVYLLDIAAPPLEKFKLNHPHFPEEHLIQEDFFQLEGKFDIIIEQTFFCALNPKLRHEYAQKAASLLAKGGVLAGVMFGVPLNEDQPPFGGSRKEYIKYFEPYFDIVIMEPCYNSIKPRAGSELFIKLLKK